MLKLTEFPEITTVHVYSLFRLFQRLVFFLETSSKCFPIVNSSRILWKTISNLKENDHAFLSFIIYIYRSPIQERAQRQSPSFLKVALGVCFALKSWKEYLLLFTYLITLGKDVTFPLITKFKTDRPLSYLFVNQIPN